MLFLIGSSLGIHSFRRQISARLRPELKAHFYLPVIEYVI